MFRHLYRYSRQVHTYINYSTRVNISSFYSLFSLFSWRRGPVTELEPLKLIVATITRGLGARTGSGGGGGDSAKSMAM